MKKVMVFGTFDILHLGHLDFFRQARKLGDYLIVVVARDKFVREAKGKYPKNPERIRASNVRKSSLINKTILGSRTHNFYTTIRTYIPDCIALGYDQKPSIEKLKRDLRKHRVRNVKIVRLNPYKSNIYKSSKLNILK